MATRGLRDLRPPPPSSAITRIRFCARFTFWLACPPEQGRGQGTGAGHPSQGPACLAPSDQPGPHPRACHWSICWMPAPCQAHTLPPLSFAKKEGELFTALFNSWEREESDPGHTACDSRAGTPAHALGHPPAQQHLLGPGASLGGHLGLISGAWSWSLSSTGSNRLSPPWSTNCHHNQRSSNWTRPFSLNN